MEICENRNHKIISNETEKYEKNKIIKILHSKKIKKSQHLNELYNILFNEKEFQII